MFKFFREKRKLKGMQLKREIFKEKVELLKLKNKIFDKKPTETDKILSKLDDIEDLKVALSQDGQKHPLLQALENPFVQKLVLAWASKQGITGDTSINEAVTKLPPEIQKKIKEAMR